MAVPWRWYTSVLLVYRDTLCLEEYWSLWPWLWTRPRLETQGQGQGQKSQGQGQGQKIWPRGQGQGQGLTTLTDRPAITEYRSWCVVMGMAFERSCCRIRFFLLLDTQQQQHYTEMCLHFHVSFTSRGSPATCVSIPAQSTGFTSSSSRASLHNEIQHHQTEQPTSAVTVRVIVINTHIK